jgi:hypothetical protein
MNIQQLAFVEIVSAAEEAQRASLAELRQKVAEWFASLTPRQRDTLGAWVNGPAQYDMFVALAAEAGSWEYERRKELWKCLA